MTAPTAAAAAPPVGRTPFAGDPSRDRLPADRRDAAHIAAARVRPACAPPASNVFGPPRRAAPDRTPLAGMGRERPQGLLARAGSKRAWGHRTGRFAAAAGARTPFAPGRMPGRCRSSGAARAIHLPGAGAAAAFAE